MEGWTQKDGKLPVNPSGGLKAKGHPIGATGVSMHVLTAMQLAGEAGGMQVPDADARRHLQHGRRGGGELRLACWSRRSSEARRTSAPKGTQVLASLAMRVPPALSERLDDMLHEAARRDRQAIPMQQRNLRILQARQGSAVDDMQIGGHHVFWQDGNAKAGLDRGKRAGKRAASISDAPVPAGTVERFGCTFAIDAGVGETTSGSGRSAG